MKEIRFRAWEKDYKYMNYKVMVGNVWDEENYQWVAPEKVGYECEPGWKHFDENSNIELMQYTGLKDKNGTEIYEGDILRCDPDTANEDVKVVEYVASEYDGVGFKPLIDQYYDNGCLYSVYEVIGNIYENPELLERDGKWVMNTATQYNLI